MKRKYITSLLAALTITATAQEATQPHTGNTANRRKTFEKEARMEDNFRKDAEDEMRKGSYITVSGGIGSSAFDYKLTGRYNDNRTEKGKRSGKLGYGVDVKYTYLFNRHWGITSGIGLSRYATEGKLTGDIRDDQYMPLGNLTDNDTEGRPRHYELRARLKNLKESQTAWMAEIPLMATYQTWFKGDSARWGMYAGAGIKLQLPVSAKFKIKNGETGELNVSGYYKDIPTDMGSPSNPPVPQHGYGTITNPNEKLDWDDKLKLKPGIAAAAELGFMRKLGDNTDLLLGGYIDYGLNDIKKHKDRNLLKAPAVYHPDADNKVGTAITYNGMINSTATGKIRLISFGVKLGVRFKL